MEMIQEGPHNDGTLRQRKLVLRRRRQSLERLHGVEQSLGVRLRQLWVLGYLADTRQDPFEEIRIVTVLDNLTEDPNVGNRHHSRKKVSHRAKKEGEEGITEGVFDGWRLHHLFEGRIGTMLNPKHENYVKDEKAIIG